MKMIKRAKDHVSAAFHCALFHGHRMKRSGNGTNEFMQMSRKWKRANGNSTALCPPKLGKRERKKALRLCWGLSSFLSRTSPFEGFSLRCRLSCLLSMKTHLLPCLQLLHFLQLLCFFVSLCCFECRLLLEFNLLSVQACRNETKWNRTLK